MSSADLYDVVIGLEVHCQLQTESKLFCGCSTKFGGEPNEHSCPVCLGMPGVLPVLNTKAVDYAVRMALAVGARLNKTSVFARKQYFYPDLPKGYQITQFDLPYCEGGGLTIETGKTVRLIRIHIEEDAGKNVHGSDASFVDVNRAGTPLVEIVSHPDLSSAREAVDYLKRLRSLVKHLGICDGNMEEGSFRCDANVSLRPKAHPDGPLGTRCEIKNLNSFRNIERAIEYEMSRQAEILGSGAKLVQQTVLFDANTGRTAPMRSKEDSHDYRYIPDPDLPALKLSDARIEAIRAALPELPEAMAGRFRSEFGLSDADAALLTSERELSVYFQDAVRGVAGKVPPKIVANWITTELLREVNERNWDLAACPVPASALAELLGLLGDGTISGKIAKTVFQDLVETGGSPKAIVEARGLVQVNDEGAALEVINKVLGANPAQVADYVGGLDRVFGFFVGQVMRQSGGKLNPGLVNQLLRRELDARKK